jgi:hypothetical protein
MESTAARKTWSTSLGDRGSSLIAMAHAGEIAGYQRETKNPRSAGIMGGDLTASELQVEGFTRSQGGCSHHR